MKQKQKKNYLAPHINVLQFAAQGIIASSLTGSGSDSVDSEFGYSNSAADGTVTSLTTAESGTTIGNNVFIIDEEITETDMKFKNRVFLSLATCVILAGCNNDDTVSIGDGNSHIKLTSDNVRYGACYAVTLTPVSGYKQ